MKEQFIDEPIEVIYDFNKLKPISFSWRGKKFEIVEITNTYQEFGFSPTGPNKKNWRIRRHRNYYIVRIETKERFKIYLDRAGRKRQWILLSKYV